MEIPDIQIAFDKLKFGEDAFHELMRWRVLRVLLVLPHYDSWILEHDAKLSDQIVGEYHQLNLTTVPRLTTVADGKEALRLLQVQKFDLMIIGMRVGALSPETLAHQSRCINSDLAILMLMSSRSDLSALLARTDFKKQPSIDACFLWTGDSRLFLAMIKYIEDSRNAPSDAENGRVGVLLVVEDSIPFYSVYLPLLYGEIMTQTQRLIGEEMNDSDKYWRMRTRPKVLLARDWEEALSLGETYQEALIGIVSDIAFQRGGTTDMRAGFSLVERFRTMGILAPVLFQSSDNALSVDAERCGARFQSKASGDLHRGIRRFILEELGFGDFVFQKTNGDEIHRVSTLREFELALDSLPVDTLLYHGLRDDYSRWMAAHGEYRVARRIKPVHAEDFPDADAYRDFLAKAFRDVRESRQRGRLVDFHHENLASPGAVIRYGSGSLGGKGRGLAFFNAVLNTSFPEESFVPLKVEIPRTFIIATGEFDKFIDNLNFPIDGFSSDQELYQIFLDLPLDKKLCRALAAFAERVDGPLAIRSSALLEDSQSIPLAGVYNTYMIPGGGVNSQRLALLYDAVRLVWASTFSAEAVQYRNALGVGLEDEKMAVVIQPISGCQHGDFWFPRLSGTAQSLNYYPVGCMERDDGVARIAVGLGRQVVGGEQGFLFSPRYPEIALSTEKSKWREGQTHFWALQCDYGDDLDLSQSEGGTLKRLSIQDAEQLNVLHHMVSTWDPVGQRVVDGMDIPGPRVVDYRDILSYEWLPLAPLLDYILRLAYSAMGVPVDIEFALDWPERSPEGAVFSLLQVRPLISRVGTLMTIPNRPDDSQLLMRSSHTLGHGMNKNITDVVWVSPERYDPGKTEILRDQIATIMDELAAEDRYAILIGPGRWGSRDRFLGVPVSWTQIRQAKFIVEIARGPGDPEPSQGSHFFHNLVALGVGYAHVSMEESHNFVDWSLLFETSSGDGPVYHSHFSFPLSVVIDGRNGHAWVSKSE